MKHLNTIINGLVLLLVGLILWIVADIRQDIRHLHTRIDNVLLSRSSLSPQVTVPRLALVPEAAEIPPPLRFFIGTAASSQLEPWRSGIAALAAVQASTWTAVLIAPRRRPRFFHRSCYFERPELRQKGPLKTQNRPQLPADIIR